MKYAPLPKSLIRLKAANDKYVCANRELGNIVIANSDNGWEWETFTLVTLANNSVALYSSDRKYFSADPSNKMDITASKEKIGLSETFTMLKLTNDSVAFKTVNNKYLTVDENTKQLFASVNVIGKNEKFRMIVVE